MDGSPGRRRLVKYIGPEVKDYGNLVALTAETAGMAHLGLGTMAAASGPPVPSSGGGGTLGTPDTGSTLGDAVPGGGNGTGGGDGDVAGAGESGGDASGGGGGGGGGGAAGKLPFTGFAAAGVAALGAGLSAAGVAARKYLSRD